MSVDRSRLPDPIGFLEDTEGLKFTGRGEWRSCRCPFHDDTSPSMRVNSRSGAFKCMAGCGAGGGDLIAWVMQRDRVDFQTACKNLGLVDHYTKAPANGKPHALTDRDRLEALAQESLVLFVLGCDAVKCKELPAISWDRMALAIKRIRNVAAPGDEEWKPDRSPYPYEET